VVDHGDLHVENAAGSAQMSITRHASVGYTIEFTDVDGYHTAEEVSGNLLPGDHFMWSALPFILDVTTRQQASWTALSMGLEGPELTHLTISKQAVISTPEESRQPTHTYSVQMNRPGARSTQTYTFAGDGTFLEMVEPLNFGLHSLRPGEAG
jgi:hypothetical protein